MRVRRSFANVTRLAYGWHRSWSWPVRCSVNLYVCVQTEKVFIGLSLGLLSTSTPLQGTCRVPLRHTLLCFCPRFMKTYTDYHDIHNTKLQWMLCVTLCYCALWKSSYHASKHLVTTFKKLQQSIDVHTAKRRSGNKYPRRSPVLQTGDQSTYYGNYRNSLLKNRLGRVFPTSSLIKCLHVLPGT